MRKVFAAFILFALIFAGITFALPLLLNTDTLRAALSRQLSSASGAEISLNGPVRFSVVPDFGIIANDLAFAAPDGSASITAKRAVAAVSMMSLLSDKIRITGIELEAPRIVLSKADGERIEPSPQSPEEGDIFATTAAYLEGLAIDRVRISNGEVYNFVGDRLVPAARSIELNLSVPGIERPALLAFSAIVDGTQINLEGEIGSLRDLLQRQPAKFSLSAAMSPPPHPALAKLGASGHIQLADDGSYRIEGGEITTAGQPMRVDAAYVPGNRPYIQAKIETGTLDFSDIAPEQNIAERSEGGTGKDDRLDLSALRNIDLDFELRADAVRAGDAHASDVVLQATLKEGKLETSARARNIAGGELASSVIADVNDVDPEFRGYLNLSTVDIASLVKLAGQQMAIDGQLSSQLQYAFRGTGETAIRNTLNLQGVVTIADGMTDVPALAAAVGPAAGKISALDAKVEITDIGDPLKVAGTMNWNGEEVEFASSVSLVDFLSGNTGAVDVGITSRPVSGKFTGTIAMDGSANGNANIQTASLSNLLRWVGHDVEAPVDRFSYSGAISADVNTVTLENAHIVLDDIEAAGSATLVMDEKPAIRADLHVNALDFAKLAHRGEVTVDSSSSSPSDEIDLSALRSFDADIRLKADRIGHGEIQAGPATATLTVKNAIARLSIPEAGFYSGALAANVIADGSSAEPAVDLSARLDGVDALPFLDAAGGFDRLEGKLSGRLDVKGSGTTKSKLSRSLAGTAQAVFSDGALRGIDVAKLLNNLQSVINGGTQVTAEGRTEFTQLSASMEIENGIARTEDIQLLGPLVRMDGAGSIDIAGQSIDMRLNPRVVASLSGQGGEFDVDGIGMPVVISGPLAEPRLYPDIAGILANPGHALQTISKLRGLGTVGKDAANILEQSLGNEGGITAETVTGVIQHLNRDGSQQDGLDEGSARAGDIAGSLLHRILGKGTEQDQAQQPQAETSLQPRTELPDSWDTTTDAEAPPELDVLGTDQDAPVILPTSGVPIPTPNPRRHVVDLSHQPDPESEPARTLPEQIADQIAPNLAPAGVEDETVDLIKGLLNQLEN